MTDLRTTENNKSKKLLKKESNIDPDPLEKIKLNHRQMTGILTNAALETVVSSTPIIGKMYEWAERSNQASREEKLKILLIKYNSRFDSNEKAISNLKSLADSRGGQTIFRKIIQIVDKGQEDQEWIQLLAIALKKISETDFEKYFDAQMFILSQIDKLSPQSLILLSEYDIWRSAHIQGTTTTSGKTMGDWIPQVTMLMRRSKGIDNLEAGARIGHSFRELETAGLIELRGHELKLTAIGIEINRAIIS